MSRYPRRHLLVMAMLLIVPAAVHAQHSGSHAAPSGGCTPEHAAMGHCTMQEPAPAPPATSPHDAHAADDSCTPEHAAMGHCSMPASASHATPPHDAPAPHAGCTPEHAAMGHCTMPATAPQQPRTPVPVPTDADRAAALPDLHHHSMEHASPITSMVLLDRLEVWDADAGTGQTWEAKAWIGGDLHRLWLRSEGERSGGRTGSARLEALYGRSLTAWWDGVAGVRQDVQPHGRTWAALGVQGLAPHMFEISATAYVGSGGQVQVKAEAEYDIRFTNRLVLQPMVEATVSATNEPQAGIGAGLGSVETGLRLRYVLSRRFAPYVGLVHERRFGNTAAYADAAGAHARDTRVVVGIRAWF